MSHRPEKVGSLIQKYLGEGMQMLDLPFLTTIKKVEVTPDMKHAKVWISVLPAGEANEAEIVKILKSRLYHFQRELLKKLAMKVVPRVGFAIDHSGEYTSHIDTLIKKIHEEE